MRIPLAVQMLDHQATLITYGLLRIITKLIKWATEWIMAWPFSAIHHFAFVMVIVLLFSTSFNKFLRKIQILEVLQKGTTRQYLEGIILPVVFFITTRMANASCWICSQSQFPFAWLLSIQYSSGDIFQIQQPQFSNNYRIMVSPTKWRGWHCQYWARPRPARNFPISLWMTPALNLSGALALGETVEVAHS